MRLGVGDTKLWVDVSGPSVVVKHGELQERPTLVSVHGGPGLDHIGLKDTLEPIAADVQVVFYDQRGHGRSDYGDRESWNLKAWATDLRDLCDVLGLDRPVVLGTSFGGFVALTCAALFPDHLGGLILTNTTGGRSDQARSIEVFRRIGGEQAAAVAAKDFVELTEESAAEFNRVCYPLFSAKPGFVEEAAQRMALSTHTTEVNLHYWREEAPKFDPWTLLSQVTCPVLVVGGEDDPMCPIELVQELANALVNAASVELLRLPNARHTVFRDAPDTVIPALRAFVKTHASVHPRHPS